MTTFDLDALLDALADMVAERVAARLRPTAPPAPNEWLKPLEAAAVLKLSAARLERFVELAAGRISSGTVVACATGARTLIRGLSDVRPNDVTTRDDAKGKNDTATNVVVVLDEEAAARMLGTNTGWLRLYGPRPVIGWLLSDLEKVLERRRQAWALLEGEKAE